MLQAWCLLLTEWGYSGHRYTQDEIEIIEQDLECLRQYAAENDIVLEVWPYRATGTSVQK